MLKKSAVIVLLVLTTVVGTVMSWQRWDDLRAQNRVLAKGAEAVAMVVDKRITSRSRVYLNVEWTLPNGSKRLAKDIRASLGTFERRSVPQALRIKYLPAAANVRPVLMDHQDSLLWFDLGFFLLVASLAPLILLFGWVGRLRGRQQHARGSNSARGRN